MLEILKDNPWLIAVLAALLVPIFAIIVGVAGVIVSGGNRKAAMRVLETYAAQGKEPPPEVLRALRTSNWVEWQDEDNSWQGSVSAATEEAQRASRHAAEEAQRATADAMRAAGASRAEVRSEWRAGAREWRRAARRWRRSEPFRSWRMAIQLGVLAGGFYAGSLLANLPGTQKGFLLTAIILGALAVGSAVSAILATIYRDR